MSPSIDPETPFQTPDTTEKTMTSQLSSPTRDLVGYGRNPPHPRWPEEARIALQFVMNYEEGSEYSIPDGCGNSTNQHLKRVFSTTFAQARDLLAGGAPVVEIADAAITS